MGVEKKASDGVARNGGDMGGHGKDARSGTGKVHAVTWLLLAVLTTAALTLGACALWLPDREPVVLGQAGEVTSAPVGRQQYTGAQSVKVVPALSAAQELRSNTSGMVTEDASASGLQSGRTAMRVDDRPVVALATAMPLYRGLKVEDEGNDVQALNAELARLYPDIGVDAQAAWYHYATMLAVQRMMADAGVPDSDGSLPLESVLWIPGEWVAVKDWTGTMGARVTAGAPIGSVPGTITGIAIRNGTPSDRDRTLTVLGQTVTLPAGRTDVDDAEFCRKVTQTQEFQMMLTGGADLSVGIDASVALAEPVEVLRVPAAAVFGVDQGGAKGCVAVRDDAGDGGAEAEPDVRIIPVSIVGAELGVSLVQTQDAHSEKGGQSGTVAGGLGVTGGSDQVLLGSAIKGLTCG